MTDPADGRTRRHLQLLTDTVAAVSSSLDLSEVLARIASTVADAMATDACFVYLHDEPAGVLELRATHGAVFDDPAHRPRLHLGEGITGAAAAQLEPIVIAAEAHLDPRFHRFANLHEDEYESILAVPVLSRDRLAGALNVRTRLPRDFPPDEVALLTAIAGQVGQAIENAKLYERSQRRVAELEAVGDIARSITSTLYLDEAVSQITETTTRALRADGCALVLTGDDGAAVAHRHGSCGDDRHLLDLAAAAPVQKAGAAARPLIWKQAAIGALVVCSDRDREWAGEELSLLETIARQAAAAVETARTALRGLLAQEIHHRVKNNLQTVASLLRLQLGTAGGAAPENALRDSINRILSIAAVHDLLAAARHDDVDCAGLIDRLRPMLGHGLNGRPVTTQLAPVTLPGDRATALALVFCELFSNAVEHGRGGIDVRLRERAGEIALIVADEGTGPEPGRGDGLGLSIARSLVGEQLAGTLELAANGGGRAVVRFPAVS